MQNQNFKSNDNGRDFVCLDDNCSLCGKDIVKKIHIHISDDNKIESIHSSNKINDIKSDGNVNTHGYNLRSKGLPTNLISSFPSLNKIKKVSSNKYLGKKNYS